MLKITIKTFFWGASVLQVDNDAFSNSSTLCCQTPSKMLSDLLYSRKKYPFMARKPFEYGFIYGCSLKEKKSPHETFFLWHVCPPGCVVSNSAQECLRTFEMFSYFFNENFEGVGPHNNFEKRKTSSLRLLMVLFSPLD